MAEIFRQSKEFFKNPQSYTEEEKQKAVKQNEEFMKKGFGCKGKDSAWITSFVQALLKADGISKEKARENFRQLGIIINNVTHKLQEVTEDAKYYFLEDTSEVKDFLKICDSLCETINTYSNAVVTDSKDESSLDRHFMSILFYNNKQFEESYNKVTKFITERKEFKVSELGNEYNFPEKGQIVEKKSSDEQGFKKIFENILQGKTVQVLAKLWELKIYIYIVGVLFYNIRIYMLPFTISSMLDQLIRLFGIICFSVAKDPVLFQNSIQIINVLIMKLGSFMFICITPILNKIIDSKLVRFINMFMSYLFTTYCFGWLSKILVAICNTITILVPFTGASVESGSQLLEYVKQGIISTGRSTQEIALNLGTYAILFFTQMSPAILEGFLLFFSNYAATTASSVYKYISSTIGAGTTSVSELIKTILNTWKSPGKQLVDIKPGEDIIITTEEMYKPIMIIDSHNQKVAVELINHLLKKQTISGVQNEFKEHENDVTNELILDTDNKLFKYAITTNDQGQYFIDPNMVHQNLGAIINIDLATILEKGIDEGVENATRTFKDNFEQALNVAGLTSLNTAMTSYLTSDTSNIPGMTLLTLFTVDRIYGYIKEETGLAHKTILCILVICVLLQSVTLSLTQKYLL
jgi:hypothetical protein